MSGFDVFDRASHRANQWLDDLNAELGWDERYDAYIALRAVLQALRDVLPLEEIVDFGAQLPMVVRGFYYEGWTGAADGHLVDRGAFVAVVSEQLAEAFLDPDGEGVARAVFRMLARRVSDGEIYHVGRRLPPELRPLWPEGSAKR
jgi:uncharacterized protein (DUF2267 family)